MNFGDYMGQHGRQFPRLPSCIYCPSRAAIGCHDCGAPMCKRHAAVEVDLVKCREHAKRLIVGVVTKGVLA